MDNPEHALPSLRDTFSKSFLKSREVQRESGSKFFQDNRIRTCSYIKETKDGFTAVPFYDKREEKTYGLPSTHISSWNAQTYSSKGFEHAGMGRQKTLTTYHPGLQRSRLQVPDFVPPYRNSSVLELGDRSARDTKHWKTTYTNNFAGRSNSLSNNPAIQARKNQWERHMISK